MLQTYKARLRGNILEWQDKAPEPQAAEQLVEVTVISGEDLSLSKIAQGKKMAETLAELSAVNHSSSISEPETWQRE